MCNLHDYFKRQLLNNYYHCTLVIISEEIRNFFRACDKNVLALLDIVVSNFKSYRDVSEFAGKKVAFYKRAQILIADIWLCFEGEFMSISNPLHFRDTVEERALRLISYYEHPALARSPCALIVSKVQGPPEPTLMFK